MVNDLNKKAALGRRNRRGNTIKQINKGYDYGLDYNETLKRRYERELPLSQAAMIKFVNAMREKSIKVIWFAAGKSDTTRMLKECKMWVETIPHDIANAETELGSYFTGAGKYAHLKMLKTKYMN